MWLKPAEFFVWTQLHVEWAKTELQPAVLCMVSKHTSCINYTSARCLLWLKLFCSSDPVLTGPATSSPMWDKPTVRSLYVSSWFRQNISISQCCTLIFVRTRKTGVQQSFHATVNVCAIFLSRYKRMQCLAYIFGALYEWLRLFFLFNISTHTMQRNIFSGCWSNGLWSNMKILETSFQAQI